MKEISDANYRNIMQYLQYTFEDKYSNHRRSAWYEINVIRRALIAYKKLKRSDDKKQMSNGK